MYAAGLVAAAFHVPVCCVLSHTDAAAGTCTQPQSRPWSHTPSDVNPTMQPCDHATMQPCNPRPRALCSTFTIHSRALFPPTSADGDAATNNPTAAAPYGLGPLVIWWWGRWCTPVSNHDYRAATSRPSRSNVGRSAKPGSNISGAHTNMYVYIWPCANAPPPQPRWPTPNHSNWNRSHPPPSPATHHPRHI